MIYIHQELDFTHMREHLRRIMRGESSLLSLNATNAIVSLVTTGGPRVLESQLDSKKDIERQLKLVCEEFIMAVTKLTVEPMLSFITKVTAVRVAAGGGRADATKPLREQAFAVPAKLASLVDGVNAALDDALPTSVHKMKLYLVVRTARALVHRVPRLAVWPPAHTPPGQE